MSDSYDSIVVGAGQAGPSLAVRLAEAGRRVAIVERKLVGGTCVNVGCTPTKALVASARAIHVARRAADFGVVVDGPIHADMRAVHGRLRGIAEQSREGLEKMLGGKDGVDLVRGHARFEGPRRLRVGERVLEAPEVFLNVGARARVPDLEGAEDAPFLTNSGLLDLDELPGHLVVVGGGYIGLEFAQAFRRLGSEVTVIERSPRPLSREDEDVSSVVREVLEREGVRFRLGAECISLGRGPDGVRVGVACEEDDAPVDGSHLLLAVGRTPNTDDLGLVHGEVETDERGFVCVDDRLATSAPGVWALGDCNGRGAFTHTSYDDFQVVAANLLDGEDRDVGTRVPCSAVYVDPPVGRVGMSLAEARASGRPVKVGQLPMTRVGRARERSETDGFLRVLVDAESDQVLGATIVGIRADEVVHSLLTLMTSGTPAAAMARAMHVHPTVSELLPTALQALEPLD